jgi:hypothetical protein
MLQPLGSGGTRTFETNIIEENPSELSGPPATPPCVWTGVVPHSACRSHKEPPSTDRSNQVLGLTRCQQLLDPFLAPPRERCKCKTRWIPCPFRWSFDAPRRPETQASGPSPKWPALADWWRGEGDLRGAAVL